MKVITFHESKVLVVLGITGPQATHPFPNNLRRSRRKFLHQAQLYTRLGNERFSIEKKQSKKHSVRRYG